jgi:hypothetical protein
MENSAVRANSTRFTLAVQAAVLGVTMTPRRFCYLVLEEQFDDKGFIPSAVFENESGHRPMVGQGLYASPWHWGKTFEEAKEVCVTANERLGFTREDVAQIVASSMFRTCRR